MNNINISDEELILKFQKGDQSAYTDLVNRYKDKIINFIYRYLGDLDASEDLAQETFLKFYIKKDSYREIAKFSTYIKSTVNSNWLRDMYQFGNNGKQNRKYLRFSRLQLEPFCMELVDKRNRIKMPSKKTLQKEINKINKE